MILTWPGIKSEVDDPSGKDPAHRAAVATRCFPGISVRLPSFLSLLGLT